MSTVGASVPNVPSFVPVLNESVYFIPVDLKNIRRCKLRVMF